MQLQLIITCEILGDRRLYDQSEANIRSLKALGVEPVSYGTMLSSVLLSKLPPDLRLIVSREISSDELDMERILENFKKELIARERANNSALPRNCRAQNQNQSRSSTSAFVAGTQGSPVCSFCQNSHSSADLRDRLGCRCSEEDFAKQWSLF